MSISWIKDRQEDSFSLFKNLGMRVYEIDDLEKVDDKIKELLDKNCKTIVLSNKVASFSGDIITKYKKDDNIRIIITPNRR